ncbi:acyl CoA binding protein-domain-containing protein [Biscogniauxia sp. FL1348]|nr:acyl CoA binding protein-domain-containing protein [Biscogniauxia sp. FL1348]
MPWANAEQPEPTTTPIPIPLGDGESEKLGTLTNPRAPPQTTDRVFVHALNTVKKIPKTGASRPPPNDRLRLYGLYKQAMEGDVDGVMERPRAAPGLEVEEEELQREKDKWDAWNSQSGLGRTEAKRRYIEALIDTMHHYATTPDARELVSELEFVWNQIKNNSPSSTNSSPKGKSLSSSRRFLQPAAGTDGPMKVLSPMSEDDAAAQEYREHQDEDEYGDEDGEYVKKGDKWSRKVERALTRLSVEIAALREQITSGREWKFKKEQSPSAWLKWAAWRVMKHLAIDCVVLGIVLLWMRKRKDRRLEDHVRAMLRLGREYARKVLPSR